MKSTGQKAIVIEGGENSMKKWVMKLRKVQSSHSAAQAGCEQLQGDLTQRLTVKKRQTMVGRGVVRWERIRQEESGKGVLSLNILSSKE